MVSDESKKPAAYRLERRVLDRIKADADRTGRTQTKVIEDAILRRRILSEKAQAILDAKALVEGITWDEALNEIVSKALASANPQPLPPTPPTSGRGNAATKGIQRKPHGAGKTLN